MTRPRTPAIATDMRLGPPQPAITQPGLSIFVPVPLGAATVTVYTPANGAGVDLAWTQSRTLTALSSAYAIGQLGSTARLDIPSGANYLRIQSVASQEVWCAWGGSSG